MAKSKKPAEDFGEEKEDEQSKVVWKKLLQETF